MSVNQFDEFADNLPIYVQLELLARVDDEKFRLLCSSNKELRKICLGKQTSEEIAIEGNRSEFLYEARCKDKFTQDVIELRRYEPGITWKEFYDRISIFILYEKDYNLVNYYTTKGYLIELTLIDLKRINGIPSLKNIAFNEDIHILEYLYSHGIIPIPYDFDAAYFYNKNKSIEWAKSKGIQLNTNLTSSMMVGITERRINFYPHFKKEILELIESQGKVLDEQIVKFFSFLLPPCYTFTRIIEQNPWYKNTLIVIPVEEMKSDKPLNVKESNPLLLNKFRRSP